MMTTLTYAGATGAFIAEKPVLGTRPSIGGSLFALMGPLHFGNFAGWWSKAVWFALGAASSYVTFSGLALWVRRRQERPGWRALGRLNAWFGAGLPLALAASAAAFFLALPTGTTLFWTPAAFLIAAGLALIPTLIARAERIVPLLSCATGVVLLALPILRIATGGPSWSTAFAAGQMAIPVLDILVSIAGVACLLPLRTLIRRETPEAEPRSPSRSWAQPAE
jgi:PepSY-associated TM region